MGDVHGASCSRSAACGRWLSLELPVPCDADGPRCSAAISHGTTTGLGTSEMQQGWVTVHHSIRAIAARIGRAPSTVSREIERNGGRVGYRANQADSAAWDRAHRPKRCKLAQNRALARVVTDKLRLLWSPEQIAGWLKHTYPCDEAFHVSRETIYRSLFIQARGALKKELLEHRRRTRGISTFFARLCTTSRASRWIQRKLSGPETTSSCSNSGARHRTTALSRTRTSATSLSASPTVSHACMGSTPAVLRVNDLDLIGQERHPKSPWLRRRRSR